METNRRIILVLAIAAFILPAAILCWAAEKEEEDIWIESERKEPRRKMFELTDEEIDRIMTRLKKSSPEKTKELLKLRQENPEKFKNELVKYGREEYGKIIRERIDGWKKKIRDEFIIWLEKNYPKQAKELATLKEKQPSIYWKKFDLIRKRYWRIFEEEKRNPELAEVLKEDLELTKKRDELIRQIIASSNEQKTKRLSAELEEVVAIRFDLIIRRKHIAYERLLKRLEQLQKQVKESRNEIGKWMNEKVKVENVKRRMRELTEGIPKFAWD